jgi:hypothetical protein
MAARLEHNRQNHWLSWLVGAERRLAREGLGVAHVSSRSSSMHVTFSRSLGGDFALQLLKQHLLADPGIGSPCLGCQDIGDQSKHDGAQHTSRQCVQQRLAVDRLHSRADPWKQDWRWCT